MRRVVEDVAGVLSGALSIAAGLRGSTRSAMRRRAEDIVGRMDLVTREEFEAVKEMAAKAREEQERLAEELAATKAASANGAASKPASKSSAAKSQAKPRTKTAATKKTASGTGRATRTGNRAPRKRRTSKT